MSIFGEALRELNEARDAHRTAARNGSLSEAHKARRIAATRRVHYLELPSVPCTCRICRDWRL